MVKGREFDPKWVGPYRMVRKVSDLVYGIQMRKREANMHVEQLKLCRDSREELRERRKQHRRRRREQAPRLEREQETDPDDVMSENYEEGPSYSYASYERQSVDGSDRTVSANRANTPTEEKKEIELETERDDVSAASDNDPSALNTPEAIESSETQHDYSLRPRIPRNYKE
jgi:hypothetical protein